MRRCRAVFIIFALLSAEIGAKQPRSYAAKAEFKRLHPCPANGQRRGPCPGWVIDHVDPLCNGGADHPSNMQWQTIADAKAKDKEEVRLCAANRHNKNPQ